MSTTLYLQTIYKRWWLKFHTHILEPWLLWLILWWNSWICFPKMKGRGFGRHPLVYPISTSPAIAWCLRLFQRQAKTFSGGLGQLLCLTLDGGRDCWDASNNQRNHDGSGYQISNPGGSRLDHWINSLLEKKHYFIRDLYFIINNSRELFFNGLWLPGSNMLDIPPTRMSVNPRMILYIYIYF